jgi:hypothetical protein
MECYLISYIFSTLWIKSESREVLMNLFYFTLDVVTFVPMLNGICGLIWVVLYIRYLKIMVLRNHEFFGNWRMECHTCFHGCTHVPCNRIHVCRN